jgi:glucosylceramidase
MKRLVILIGLFVPSTYVLAQVRKQVMFWLSDPGQSLYFQKQESLSVQTKSRTESTITIDVTKTYQAMDGFGFSLTGGSAHHLMGMSAKARAALLKELFSTEGEGIGVNYLRISIGASDLNAYPFSYNDLPEGEIDTAMEKFDLGPDKTELIPVLKEILAIYPALKIMASPWSPPKWMKTNNDSRGGSLKPEYYEAYAKYFLRYIREMQKLGIRIDAITVQNEPLHPGNNPSLLMQPEEQLIFVGDFLGPAFRRAGIKTKIVIYDHNADRPDYPISILDDEEARKYIDGSAFHLYAGGIDALSKVHEAHPDKRLYFTEQWIGGPGNFKEDMAFHIRELIIGAPRNWCRTVLEWNLSSDPEYKPHTDRGGCDRCLGGVTIDRDSVVRNPGYYIIAHASKFVRPGSIRVASNNSKELPNVAFKTPQGKLVIIVFNNTEMEQRFSLRYKNLLAETKLAAGAAATYVW